MTSIFTKSALLLALGIALPTIVWPHGGGLDGHGCHHNRKAGGYHCHRGSLAGKHFGSKAEMLKQLQPVDSRRQTGVRTK